MWGGLPAASIPTASPAGTRPSIWRSRPSRRWRGACIPERQDPLLQFTVPEALAVIERASANLRGFLVSSFPLGRPHHGRPADVALSLARRHVLGREGLRPVAHRAAAQSGRGRHAGAARALHAPDLRGRPRAPGAPAGARLRQGGRPRGHRPLRRQPARCAGPACQARDVDLGQGPGGGRDARGRARAHPGGGADRRRQVEPGERARQCGGVRRRRGARHRELCRLPADARGPARGVADRQPGPHRDAGPPAGGT